MSGRGSPRLGVARLREWGQSEWGRGEWGRGEGGGAGAGPLHVADARGGAGGAGRRRRPLLAGRRRRDGRQHGDGRTATCQWGRVSGDVSAVPGGQRCGNRRRGYVEHRREDTGRIEAMVQGG